MGSGVGELGKFRDQIVRFEFIEGLLRPTFL